MAIDPRIVFQAQTPNLSNTFSNLLTNVQALQDFRRRQELEPIQTRLLEAQAERAETGAIGDRERQRISSLATAGAELLPFLQNNDIEGARRVLTQRRANLKATGTPTMDTDEALQLLDTNPQLLAQRAGQAVQLGRQFGVLGAGQGATASQRERQSLLATLEDPSASEDAKRSARIALGLEARASNIDEKLRFEVDRQRQVGDIKTQQAEEKALRVTRAKLKEQTLAIPEQERVQFLSENRNNFSADLSESQRILNEIDRAIEIWETAPGTISGPIASRLPALAAETQELESILAGLGIDRLANFKGATSERELATAFRAGASIEQDAQAGIRRLQKQRSDIVRSNSRLRGLLNESNKLLRQQPEQPSAQQPEQQPLRSSVLGREVTEQDIQDTLNANPGITREQIFQQLGIQ